MFVYYLFDEISFNFIHFPLTLPTFSLMLSTLNLTLSTFSFSS